MNAGVESRIAPSGCVRTKLMRPVTSYVFRYGLSVDALAAVNAIMLPLGSRVKMLRQLALASLQ